ncbi:hypothetical protein LH612_36055, partial [Klebsiella pneumoniae]|nr:hypothetical protein [Klebsiella pneumoniae]
MLVIDEEKFPPPTPAVAPMSANTHSGVPGCCTNQQASAAGTSSTAVLKIVQFRPPNRVTAAAYG